MISFQTNYAAMVGEANLNTNQIVQTKTIEALTSGYRINSSGDDAAGLAVANGYRNQVSQLTQGMINANSAVSQLQIMDGGLNNISNILDRLQTLATESASSTFSGNRTILNNEYQSLLSEVDRQAANIGLNTGGKYATNLTTYIGGGDTQADSQVGVDLTGNAVDTAGLGLSNTNLLGLGTDFSGTVNLNTQNTPILQGANDTETFTVYLAGNSTPVTANVISPTAAGLTVQEAITQLNSSLTPYGVTASIDQTTGNLQLSGDVAFTAIESGTSGLVTGGATIADNGEMNTADGAVAGTFGTNAEVMTFTTQSGATKTVTMGVGDSSAALAVTDLNNQLASLGISAVLNTAGTGINFESTQTFSIDKTSANAGVFAGGANTYGSTTPATTGSPTANSLQAVAAIQSAVGTLGLVQGVVGGGENRLQYAINLATSQSTNISSAESQLRDADVATEAANLTKSQVLEQSSVAALAQANATPQAILKLLQ